MKNIIYLVLDAIERHKAFTSHNVKVIPEPYGSRIFLFDKLFAIVDTDKQELFIEPPKPTGIVSEYTQSLIDYFYLNVSFHVDEHGNFVFQHLDKTIRHFIIIKY